MLLRPIPVFHFLRKDIIQLKYMAGKIWRLLTSRLTLHLLPHQALNLPPPFTHHPTNQSLLNNLFNHIRPQLPIDTTVQLPKRLLITH